MPGLSPACYHDNHSACPGDRHCACLCHQEEKQTVEALQARVEYLEEELRKCKAAEKVGFLYE